VLDVHGQVVRQASQLYRLSGPVRQMDQAQRGAILFFRQPELAPGSYTLEVAIHDGLARRSGVHRSSFVVPETAASLQVSSLAVVERVERLRPEDRPRDNPLYAANLLVYPNLGEPIRKARDKTLAFYVVVIPGPGVAPQATLEVFRDGQAVGQSPTTFGAADESGRIAHLAQLSVERLSPGSYTLRLTVTQGNSREVRDTIFRLID
jgi:hypothetical protein